MWTWVAEVGLVNTPVGCQTLPVFDIPADSDYTDKISIILPRQPLATNFVTNQRQPGFGILDGAAYASIRECRHNGFDFFATNTSVTEVYAMWDGIIVGIGDSSEQSSRPRPYLWGAASSNEFNVVIRTGGHYILYGHLQSVEDFYLGQRVNAGTKIGAVANQGNNTHLHIQISFFNVNDAQNLLHTRFGAIKAQGIQNPSHVVDFMRFLPTDYRGTLTSVILSAPVPCSNSDSGSPTATYHRYDNALLPETISSSTIIYSYEVNSDVELKCFNVFSGSISNSCNPAAPPTLPSQ